MASDLITLSITHMAMILLGDRFTTKSKENPRHKALDGPLMMSLSRSETSANITEPQATRSIPYTITAIRTMCMTCIEYYKMKSPDSW